MPPEMAATPKKLTTPKLPQPAPWRRGGGSRREALVVTTMDTQMTTAQATAFELGRLLGAASLCKHVSKQRLDAFAAGASRVFAGTARDAQDLDRAKGLFTAAFRAGIEAAAAGAMDPADAEGVLAEIEEWLPLEPASVKRCGNRQAAA